MCSQSPSLRHLGASTYDGLHCRHVFSQCLDVLVQLLLKVVFELVGSLLKGVVLLLGTVLFSFPFMDSGPQCGNLFFSNLAFSKVKDKVQISMPTCIRASGT